MKINKKIEELNKELQKITKEIQSETNETNETKKSKLNNYSNEIKTNIENLSKKAELDYELISKMMLFKALQGALTHIICKRNEMKEIFEEFMSLNIPNNISEDKNDVTQYLEKINHPQPNKFEKYHDFILKIKNKNNIGKYQKNQEYIQDINWLTNPNSIAINIMESFNIPPDSIKKILNKQNEENFNKLIERYHQLNSI